MCIRTLPGNNFLFFAATAELINSLFKYLKIQVRLDTSCTILKCNRWWLYVCNKSSWSQHAAQHEKQLAKKPDKHKQNKISCVQ